MVEAATGSVSPETATREIGERLLAALGRQRSRLLHRGAWQRGSPERAMRDDHSSLRDLVHEVFAELLQEDDFRGYPHVGTRVRSYPRDGDTTVRGGDTTVRKLFHLARQRG